MPIEREKSEPNLQWVGSVIKGADAKLEEYKHEKLSGLDARRGVVKGGKHQIKTILIAEDLRLLIEDRLEARETTESLSNKLAIAAFNSSVNESKYDYETKIPVTKEAFERAEKTEKLVSVLPERQPDYNVHEARERARADLAAEKAKQREAEVARAKAAKDAEIARKAEADAQALRTWKEYWARESNPETRLGLLVPTVEDREMDEMIARRHAAKEGTRKIVASATSVSLSDSLSPSSAPTAARTVGSIRRDR